MKKIDSLMKKMWLKVAEEEYNEDDNIPLENKSSSIHQNKNIMKKIYSS